MSTSRRTSQRIRGRFQPTPVDRYGLRILNPTMEFPFNVAMKKVLLHLLNNISISIDVLKVRQEYCDIEKPTMMDIVGIGKQGEYLGQQLLTMAYNAIGLTPRYKATVDLSAGGPFPTIELKDIRRTVLVFVDDSDRANDPRADMEVVTSYYRHALRETGSRGRIIHPMILRVALASLSDRGSSWPLGGDQVALNILSEDTLSMYDYCLHLLGQTRPISKSTSKGPYMIFGLGNGGTYWARDMYHRLIDERGSLAAAKRLLAPVTILDDKHGEDLYVLNGDLGDNREELFNGKYIRDHMLSYRALVTIDDVCNTGRSLRRIHSAYRSAYGETGRDDIPPMVLISMINLSQEDSVPVQSPINIYIN